MWNPIHRFRVGVPLYTDQVMAVGSAANPGILQPGESGTVSVSFHGLLEDFGENAIQFVWEV